MFIRDPDAGVVFHPAAPPIREELDAIVRRVQNRAETWLRRHGHLDERALAERSNEPPAQTALDACAAIAMGRGHVATLPNAETPEDDHDERATGKPAVAVERDGCKVGARRRARFSPGRFPSAPFRTRRAPFVEHRALHQMA